MVSKFKYSNLSYKMRIIQDHSQMMSDFDYDKYEHPILWKLPLSIDVAMC